MKKVLLALALIIGTAQAKVHVPKNIEPSVIVYNITRDKVEYSSNADQVRPIASITKIMTAMVTLDYNKDLSRTLTLSKLADTHLPRQTYNRWQLLQAMLVRSDNGAAETLAADYPGGREEFIAQMNRQAREWGMKNTRFEDPTGLSANNVSTVSEVADMMNTAAGYWIIRDTTVKKQVAVEAQYKKKIRTINLANTNAPLLFEFDSIVVSKTGLTSKAGWCVGLVVEQRRQQYSIVVLGTKNKQERKATVEKVIYNHIVDAQLPEQELSITP
jgi:D-alanyl-D-alanine endopeptidase (penicillin-binding protein 7)